MSFAFILGRDPCADDSDDINSPLGETHQQQPFAVGVSNDDFPGLIGRMIFIEEDLGQRIAEDGTCLVETDFV